MNHQHTYKKQRLHKGKLITVVSPNCTVCGHKQSMQSFKKAVGL